MLEKRSDELAGALREHLAVCEALLALTQKEADLLKDPAASPPAEIRTERKELLSRLNNSLRSIAEHRIRCRDLAPAGSTTDPVCAGLMQAAKDTIMRVLVLDQENEQQLLRRGWLPPHGLPPAGKAQPHYVSRLYERHSQK